MDSAPPGPELYERLENVTRELTLDWYSLCLGPEEVLGAYCQVSEVLSFISSMWKTRLDVDQDGHR